MDRRKRKKQEKEAVDKIEKQMITDDVLKLREDVEERRRKFQEERDEIRRVNEEIAKTKYMGRISWVKKDGEFRMPKDIELLESRERRKNAKTPEKFRGTLSKYSIRNKSEGRISEYKKKEMSSIICTLNSSIKNQTKK